MNSKKSKEKTRSYYKGEGIFKRGQYIYSNKSKNTQINERENHNSGPTYL